MKTILDQTTRDQLLRRIDTLNENSQPKWGKMNVYQMLKHCTLAEDLYLGNTPHKRMLLGYILGKWALKNILKDGAMRRNAPTSDRFIVVEPSGDLEAVKKKWMAQLEEYANYTTVDFVHWFFGRMTKDQIGQLVYIHADHHLQQFNA